MSTTDQALPFDVLLMVMDFSCSRTIAVIMRTCRALYESPRGPRLLLRNGATLSTNVDVLSFSAFMFASAPSGRFRYLRSLTVSKGGFSDGVARRLAAILTHADLRLDSLTLIDAEEVLNSGNPVEDSDEEGQGSSFLQAFSSLATLKHIKISTIDERAHRFLDHLPHTLVSAVLVFDLDGAEWGTFSDPDSRNPIVRLAGSADTLEMLSGAGFDVRPDVVGYDVVYPRVRRIRATYKGGGAMPATAAYVHAFPGVEHLALTAPRALPWYDFQSARHSARATREANRDDQVNYGSWQRLRVVEGTTADVWALGLVCHVPELRLQGDNTRDGFALAGGGLEDVLTDVRPTSLALTVVGRSVFGSDGPLSRVLRKPAAQCLQCLDVELVFQPSEGEVEAGKLLEDMFETIVVLPLHALKLTLNYGLIGGRYRWTPPPGTSTEYFCPLERSIVDTDLKGYAKRFVDAMPSMESAVVVRSRDRKPHEYLLGPIGRNSLPPGGAQSDDGSASGGEEVMRELAELGFGGALDDEDEGW